MPKERVHRLFEAAVRLVGVGLVGAGLFLATTTLIYGIPVVAVGLLLVFRPWFASDLFDVAVGLS